MSMFSFPMWTLPRARREEIENSFMSGDATQQVPPTGSDLIILRQT
jgi:hypothetical protein